MADSQTRRIAVTGLVQGVGFRAATQRTAQSLGLLGQVRNLPDGRVEVIASGSVTALDQLEAWLQRGPPFARVQSVHSEQIAPQSSSDFRIV